MALKAWDKLKYKGIKGNNYIMPKHICFTQLLGNDVYHIHMYIINNILPRTCFGGKGYSVTSAFFHRSVGDCKVWRDDEDLRLHDEVKKHLVPSSVALAIETTAYVLLTAVELGDFEEAKMAACFLSSQENYEGGFKSTQVN